MQNAPFIPYEQKSISAEEMLQRATGFYNQMAGRRSVREFSDAPVPKQLIELAISAASTAPSGAHRQPWRFVAISDPAVKKAIRIAAEKEEREFYEGGKTPEEWHEAVAPFGTDWHKPYLETSPWIVVVFEEVYGMNAASERQKNYYVKESVGIACGMFITALHHMSLATLTHTPSPMAFLSEILGRPTNERPYILFPVGFPAPNATVPDIQRKPLKEVAVWFEE